MTLTYNQAIWFLFATHHLITMIICIFKIPQSIKKLWVGHEQVSLKSTHDVLVRTVTLTFNLATWLLFATNCLVVIIICDKKNLNPTMHNEVMGQTRTGFTSVSA